MTIEEIVHKAVAEGYGVQSFLVYTSCMPFLV